MLEIRYFAAARAAAGTETETIPFTDFEQHAGGDMAAREALISLLAGRHSEPPPGEPALNTVLAQSSFLINGVSLHQGADRQTISAGDRIDVLPPFAGG